MNVWIKQVAARNWFRYSMCLLAGIIVACLFISTAFDKKIKRFALAELRKSILTEVHMEDIDVSLFSWFPNVSLSLKNIRINDVHKQNLLSAENISVKLGLMDILSGDLNLRSVKISGASLHLKRNPDKSWNYEVWKKGKSENKNFHIAFDKIKLVNSEIWYQDSTTGTDISFYIDKGDFGGAFYNNRFQMACDATTIVDYIRISGDEYMNMRPVKLSGMMDIDISENVYSFDKMKATVSGFPFTINGDITNRNTGINYNLAIQSRNGKIENIVEALPPNLQKVFSRFKCKGGLDINMKISGIQNTKETPFIAVGFEVKNANLFSGNYQADLKKINLAGSLSFGQKKPSILSVSTLNGLINGIPLNGSLKITDFKNPTLSCRLDASVPCGLLVGMIFQNPDISGSGTIHFDNVRISGKPGNLSSINATGYIAAQNADISLPGNKIKVSNTRISLENNLISIPELRLTSSHSEMTVSGSIKGLAGFIFKSDPLVLESELVSRQADIPEIVSIYQSLTKNVNGSGTNGGSPADVKGLFDVSLKNITYENVTFNEIKGLVHLNSNNLRMNLAGTAMSGQWETNANLRLSPAIVLDADLVSRNADIKQCFTEFKNFGQKVIKEEHIRGELNSQSIVHAEWAGDGSFLKNKLKIEAAMQINNGQLVGFDLLNNFSKYIKSENLRHVQFESLQNYIAFEKNTFYLPSMFIKNNALNLTVNGYHTMDNRIDYNIKVNAGEAILRKLNIEKRNGYADANNGAFNMFYNIHGTTDHFDYKRDKSYVIASFTESTNRKNKIKRSLAAHFTTPVFNEETKMEIKPSGYETAIIDKTKTTEVGTTGTKKLFDFQQKKKNKWQSAIKEDQEEKIEYIEGF